MKEQKKQKVIVLDSYNNSFEMQYKINAFLDNGWYIVSVHSQNVSGDEKQRGGYFVVLEKTQKKIKK